jgi:uncharacterized protein involved in exopolysaccharide biosynthesis
MKAPPSPREQLERLLVLVRRSGAFWKRGLAVFVLGVLLAVPYVFTRPRSYRSETVILYQETIQASDVGGGEGSSEGSRRVGARLRELLFSRASLEPIIHDLNLYPDKIIRGEPIEAVEEMRKNVVFKAQQDGDTYSISFTGDSPKEAQEVTKRLGDCITQEAEKRREDKAKTLKEFLTAEIDRNEPDLRQKEADLTKFVVLHPEYASRLQGLPAPTTTSTVAGASPPGDPLLASLQARAARIERRLNTTTVPDPAPKPVATFHPPPDSAELVAARRNLAEKLALYTDKHPDVIAARSRLTAAEDAQAAVNASALAAWRAQQAEDPGPPPANAAEEAALKKELASLQGQISARIWTLSRSAGASADAGAAMAATSSPALELEFRRLQGEVNDARDRQQQLQARLFRASITASSVMDDRNIQVSVLDPAYLPVRPVSKPRSMLLAGLLALCLVLAIGTAFVSASFDDRIYDRHDIERMDVLPVVAIIPKPRPTEIRQLPPRTDPGP